MSAPDNIPLTVIGGFLGAGKTSLFNHLLAVDRRRAAVRPQARRIAIAHGQVPPEALDFQPSPRPASRLRADAPEDHLFVTWHWPCDAMLDRDRLRDVLADLPRAVLRVKGVCRLAPDGAAYLLHYAAERWAFTALDHDAPVGLVAIGTTDMPDPAHLATLFSTARAEPALS